MALGDVGSVLWIIVNLQFVFFCLLEVRFL